MADIQIITDVPLFTNEQDQNDKKLIVLSPSSLPFDDNPTNGSHNLVDSNTIYNLSRTLKNTVPIGTVITFAANPDNPPYGYLLCNGGAVNRTTYKELFDIIGTTYGSGDGSTTFDLPNLINKFVMCSNTAGIVKAAGLPNITGTWGTIRTTPWDGNAKGYGAFVDSAKSSSGSGGISTGSGSRAYYNTLVLNARACSSVYGRSNTVQPPAVTMRFYIKYK